MKIKLLLLLPLLSISVFLFGQQSANYNFSTDRNGSLEVMNGSTQIIGPNHTDDTYSPVFVPLGFRFLFMGEFWDEFKVSANGIIWFGNSTDFFPAAANNIGSIPNSRRISGLANLNGMKTHNNSGKVRIKVFGSAPNRYAVIEWKNMSANASSTTKDITYQVKLHESEYNSAKPGEFEFVYDKVSWGNGGSEESTCGFQVDDESGKRFNIRITDDATSNTTDLRSNTSTGTLANLNSTGTPNKKRYGFISDIVNATAKPINANCLSSNSVLLEWEDMAPNDLGYAIYASTDGVNFSFLQHEGMNASSTAITGLQTNTKYWFRVHAFNEGTIDPIGSIVELTTRDFGDITAIASGDWSDPTIWSSGTVPTATDDVMIGCIGDYTVTNNTNAECNKLTIEANSALVFNDNKDIIIHDDFTNNGTFDYSAINTEVTFKGNLINDGSLQAGTSSNTKLEGENKIIHNSGKAKQTYSVKRIANMNTSNGRWKSSTINVSGNNIRKLKSVDLNIEHTKNSEITVFLYNPSFKLTRLINYTGGDGDGYFVNLSDDASRSFSHSTQTYYGNYKPDQSLNVFDDNFEGTWILFIYDSRWNSKTGKLVDFTLNFDVDDKEILVFNNLEVDNGGAMSLATTDIDITGNLKLTSGILNMFHEHPNRLILGTNSTADVATNGNYVHGTVIKKGNTDFTFPVGDGGYAANASLTFAGGNSDDEFSVTYFNRNPFAAHGDDDGAPYGIDKQNNTIKDISGKEYWLIEQEKNTGTPVYIDLSYEDGRSGTITDPSQLVVAHLTDDGLGGKAWKNEGLGQLGNGKVKSKNVISSFSPFTLATGSGDNALTVDWLSFEVSGEKNIAEIKWSAYEYAENDHYQLERSIDGINYEIIDIIDINAEGKQEYTYYNEIPYEYLGNEILFRIKQVDMDGEFSYSMIDSYTFLLDENTISLYPVPVNNTLTIQYPLEIEEEYSISILSSTGSELEIDNLTDERTLNVSDLPAGTYVAKLIIGDQTITKPFIKQ